jgi:hypothetical protein
MHCHSRNEPPHAKDPIGSDAVVISSSIRHSIMRVTPSP